MTIDSIDFGPFPETRLGCVLHDSGPSGGATGRQSKTSWPRTKFLAVLYTSPVGYPLGFGIRRAYHIVLFFLMMIYLVVFFYLGSLGDYWELWGLLRHRINVFSMPHPFCDVLKVVEQVINRFRRFKDI